MGLRNIIMPFTTTTQIDSGTGVFYFTKFLDKGVPNFIHSRFAKSFPVPSKSSTSIKMRRYGLLGTTTTPMTEGTNPTELQASKTDITATLNQYGASLTFTDKLVFTIEDPVLNELTSAMGIQHAQTLDTLVRDVITAGTTIQYANGRASRATIATGDVFDSKEARRVVRTLKNNKAKKLTTIIDPTDAVGTVGIPSAYIGFAHPNTVYGWRDPAFVGFTPVEKYSSNRMALENEVGTIDEIRMIESTECKVFTGAGAAAIDVYATLVFGDEFYGISQISEISTDVIVKELGSSGSADPANQRGSIAWKTMFAALILNQLYGVRVEHAVVA